METVSAPVDASKAQYYAFISHKSADAKYALKLQKFIESYNLPTDVRKKTLAPKRISPLCSYEVDFSVKPLMEEMEAKLRQSRYLIVICSDALLSGDPKYINFEIETFIKIKKEAGEDPSDFIIPIIIESHEGHRTTALIPEALKAMGKDAPVAIAQKQYKSDREVFLHVISSILKLDYAVLKNRDKIRQRQRNTILYSALSILLATAVFLCIYLIPYHVHYADFVMKYGLPEGIERLSASEYKRMEGHYVITYQKFRITELAHVNSEGYLTGHGSSMARGDRPSKYEFSYGKGNSLSTVTYYDEYSRPYFMLQYSDNSVQTADIKHPLYPDDPYYLAEGFNADPSAALENSNTDWSIKTSISRYRYEYNDKGYVTKIVYLADSSNKPAADSSIYGKEFELDSLGRVVKEFYLDAKGNRRYNQENVFAKEFIYNESNDIVEYSFYDENGSLIPNDNGIILARVSYDEYHNYICAKFYDANGELCCPDKFEYAVIECEYDEAGHNTLVRYLDEKKKPIDPNKNPAKKYEYDKYGRVKCMTLVDDNEKPVFSEAYGYCSAVYECNELGMSTVISYYNDKGELACNDATGNYAQAISYYDENLNLVKKEYLDSDGKPASVRGLGYSTIVKEFDSRNRAVDYRYYMGDKPACIGDTADSKFGYHRIKFEYVDGFIAKRTVSYYDERGSLVNLKELSEEDGEITVTETYAVIEHYFKDGYVSSQKLYTADGEIYDTYYEVENADTATGEHIKRESHYNARGDIVKLRVIYYDINGIICKISSISYNDDGSAYEKLWEYSSSGLLSTYRYTDYSSDNEIVREAIYKYNNKEQYISKHEKKTADNGAYSDTSYTYRSTGETKSSVTSYYSAEGALTQMVTYDYNKDGSYTYIKEVADTDGALTTVTEANYTADDFRTFSKEYRYSEDGTKKILEFTYNEDGSYSYVSTTYDADGTATEMLEDFLNTEGLRTHCTQAFYYSDGRKKVVEYVYNDDRSCVAYSRIYNSNGEETSFNTYYYDSNGKLISDIEE